MERRSFLLTAASALPLIPRPDVSGAFVTAPMSKWTVRFSTPDGVLLAEHGVPAAGIFSMPQQVFIDGEFYYLLSSCITGETPHLIEVTCYPCPPKFEPVSELIPGPIREWDAVVKDAAKRLPGVNS